MFIAMQEHPVCNKGSILSQNFVSSPPKKKKKKNPSQGSF